MDQDPAQWHLPPLTEAMEAFSWIEDPNNVDIAINEWFENAQERVELMAMDDNAACTGANVGRSPLQDATSGQSPDDAPDMFSLLEKEQPEDVLSAWQQPQQHSLPRRRSKYQLRRSGGQARPVAIPTYGSQNSSTQSLAMQRWQDSPPQDEGASLSAIYQALEGPSQGTRLENPRIQQVNGFVAYHSPPSLASLDSGASSSSLQSARSSQSISSAPSRSNSRSTRQRRRRTTKAKLDTVDRIFKCTFCCDTFKHKYDWTRHERSLHLSIEEWRCTPHGGSVVMPSTGRVHCAYCSALDPTADHLEQHNHSDCHGSEGIARAFRRKDHLVQHLRLFHLVETLPLIDDWKVEPFAVVSRCGFCDASLKSWEERTDHIAAHFRKGKTMADWRGDHGFDVHVAARVTGALEPYLIAEDARSIIPFSATNPASRDHYEQISSHIDPSVFQSSIPLDVAEGTTPYTGSFPVRQDLSTTTFVNVLSHHLGQFARQQMSMGVTPTDEMFQRESRRVMFGDEDDNWNQTLADNQDWMKAFRQQNGCDEQAL